MIACKMTKPSSYWFLRVACFTFEEYISVMPHSKWRNKVPSATYGVFWFTWLPAILVYWNKRKYLHKNNSQRFSLGHQHGRRDVMWKHSIILTFTRRLQKIHHDSKPKLTCATDVVMIVPPAAPIVINTLPFLSSMITGTAEDCGLLPGLMKLAGDGGRPNSFVTLGALKSSISLL